MRTTRAFLRRRPRYRFPLVSDNIVDPFPAASATIA